MEIKGVSVKAAPEFVRKHFGSRYDEWLDALSPASREIVAHVFPSNWYPLRESVIEPTRKICDMFYGGAEEGAWEMGRASADLALRGIYKVFVRIGSPGFIISRASKIFSTMLRPGEITVTESASKRAVMQMQVAESDWLLEVRIAGWMEQALTISGCNNTELKIKQSIAKGDPVTEYVATWQ